MQERDYQTRRAREPAGTASPAIWPRSSRTRRSATKRPDFQRFLKKGDERIRHARAGRPPARSPAGLHAEPVQGRVPASRQGAARRARSPSRCRRRSCASCSRRWSGWAGAQGRAGKRLEPGDVRRAWRRSRAARRTRPWRPWSGRSTRCARRTSGTADGKGLKGGRESDRRGGSAATSAAGAGRAGRGRARLRRRARGSLPGKGQEPGCRRAIPRSGCAANPFDVGRRGRVAAGPARRATTPTWSGGAPRCPRACSTWASLAQYRKMMEEAIARGADAARLPAAGARTTSRRWTTLNIARVARPASAAAPAAAAERFFSPDFLAQLERLALRLPALVPRARQGRAQEPAQGHRASSSPTTGRTGSATTCATSTGTSTAASTGSTSSSSSTRRTSACTSCSTPRPPWASATPTKLEYAARLAAALASSASSTSSASGVAVFRDRMAEGWSPARGRNQVLPLHGLPRPSSRPAARTALNDGARGSTRCARARPGLAVVISDLLDPAGYERGLRGAARAALRRPRASTCSPRTR